MADFKVHFTTAAITGGLVAVSLLVTEEATSQAVLIYLFATILGGLLPDLDADNSYLLQLSLTLLALFFSFFVMFSVALRYSVMELALIWAGVYLLCKLVLFKMMNRLTMHRGMFHSIPAGMAAALATVMVCHALFGLDGRLSWRAALFVWLGYLLHLVLDELYSLNLLGLGSRSSLGSALKLFSRSWRATLFTYFLVGVLFWLTPAWDKNTFSFLEQPHWRLMQGHFWPHGGWFAGWRRLPWQEEE